MDQNTVLLWASIAVLAVIVVFWVRKRVKLHQAREWPIAQGQVDSTSVRLVSSGTDQSSFVSRVRYGYTVQSEKFSGEARRRFMRKSSAEKWLSSYAEGRPLIVRYNPKKSRDSVLLDDEQNNA